MKDLEFMQRAIELALIAEEQGNLPVGAVLVHEGKVVAEGRNAVWVPRLDATRHAEVEAIRALPEEMWTSAHQISLYTTLEPCLMCCGAILLHGIGRVLFGSSDGFGGAGSILPHLPTFFRDRFAETKWVGPILPNECDPLRERLLDLERNHDPRSAQ